MQSLPQIVDIDETTTDTQNKLRKSKVNFVCVGPEKYFFPDTYKVFGPQFYNLKLRPGDVFLVGHPRTGTTWCSEMIWLLNNNLDYETAKNMDIDHRVPLMDLCLVCPPESIKELIWDSNKKGKHYFFVSNDIKSGLERILEMKSPRYAKTHMPLSLLPPNLVDKAKVVYLARDPRDVVVSVYHLLKRALFEEGVSFKTFWDIIWKPGMTTWAPYFPHLKEGWKLRNHPNVLFLQYEELSNDLAGTLRRMCSFFGKSYTDEQIRGLCQHLSFEQFKTNPAVNQGQGPRSRLEHTKEEFIRKGKVGGWRDYFKGDLEKELEEWVADGLKYADCPLYRTINY